MSRDLTETHPLHRLFRGITEFTFQTELGIADPGLVGYVANLLARFVPNQEVWKIRDGSGRRIEAVAGMIAEAESSDDVDRRRDCHRHVGDFALFWTGVYPEALGRLQAKQSADQLVQIKEQGKRSYYLAGTLDSDHDRGPLLRRLSAEFELCAFGLSRVRREWERRDSGDSDLRPLIIA